MRSNPRKRWRQDDGLGPDALPVCHGCLAEIVVTDSFCPRCGEWAPGLSVFLPLEGSMIQARFLGSAWTALWRGRTYSRLERAGAALVVMAALPFWLTADGLIGVAVACLLAYELWLGTQRTPQSRIS